MKFRLFASTRHPEKFATKFPKHEHKEWDAVLETKDWIGGYGDLVSKLPDSKFRPEGGVSSGVGHRLFYDFHYDQWIVEVETLEELIQIRDESECEIIIDGIDDETGLRALRMYDDYE